MNTILDYETVSMLTDYEITLVIILLVSLTDMLM